MFIKKYADGREGHVYECTWFSCSLADFSIMLDR